MNLHKRLAMLRGVYGQQMPYRDPHAAAPALWALVQEGGALEVSVAPVEGPKPWRLGLEAVVFALYRQQHGCSPTYRQLRSDAARIPDVAATVTGRVGGGEL